jgi:hypothetical protein
MTLDLMICIQGVPIAGIAVSPSSARHLICGNSELEALAGLDHEVSLTAVADLASYRVLEEAVLKPIEDEDFQVIERRADLAAGTWLCPLRHYAAVPSCP